MMQDEAREEDAGGMFRPKEKNSRCRVTECNRGMGDDCIGFCWIVVNRAGRTELMPKLAEACVESGERTEEQRDFSDVQRKEASAKKKAEKRRDG